MNTTATNRLPISQRPKLRLKLTPTPTPTFVGVEPVARFRAPGPAPTATKVAVEPAPLNDVEVAGRARRAERRAAVHAEAVEVKRQRAARVERQAAHLERDALRLRVLKMQETLCERYPACFKMSGTKLPLKIGIDKDVISAAPDLNEDDVRWAIKVYVRDPAYLEMMIEGAARVDLDGHPVGVVTENEARWAVVKSGRE